MVVIHLALMEVEYICGICSGVGTAGGKYCSSCNIHHHHHHRRRIGLLLLIRMLLRVRCIWPMFKVNGHVDILMISKFIFIITV